ncbi:MAG: hypothetical protein ABI650_12080 [Dokdonella sp.]
MIKSVLHGVLVGFALAAVAACSSPAADKQREEEAINRGEALPGAPVATPEDAFANDCTSSAGLWNATTQHCTVTQAMCTTLGEWRDSIGCVLPAVDASGCSGTSGHGMVGDACVITYVTRELATQI